MDTEDEAAMRAGGSNAKVVPELPWAAAAATDRAFGALISGEGAAGRQ